jgi:hypothetical protein
VNFCNRLDFMPQWYNPKETRCASFEFSHFCFFRGVAPKKKHGNFKTRQRCGAKFLANASGFQKLTASLVPVLLRLEVTAAFNRAKKNTPTVVGVLGLLEPNGCS